MFTIIAALAYALALVLVVRGVRRSQAGGTRRDAVTGLIAGALVLLTVWGGYELLDLYGEKLWFDELGYGARFTGVLFPQVALALGGAAAGALVAGAVGRLALVARPVLLALVALAAFLGGSTALGLWRELLLFRNAVDTGTSDPVLGHDVGFYLFRLPLYRALLWPLLTSLALGAAASALTLGIRQGSSRVPPQLRQIMLRFERRPANWVAAAAAPQRALLVALGLIVALLGYRQWLARYDLVIKGTGFPAGAGYVDSRFLIPGLSLLAVLFALFGVGVAAIALLRRDRPGLNRLVRLAGAGGVGLAILWVVAALVVPAVVQRFRVSPNELSAERPYIERSIAFTRRAFAIDSVAERMLPAVGTLTADDAAANRDLLREIPLWDYRALLQVFSQFQEIRLYYAFADVDIDRYPIGGTTRQVMIAPRELDQSALPEQSRTFLNLRFKYTHGYGIVAAPVSDFTPDGQPRYLVSNIPPRGTEPALELTRPEIYFGELTAEHVYVNSLEPEFDYPSGEQNVESSYQGTGGVPLSSFLRKLAYAKRFDGTRLLFARHVTPETRILFRRQIRQRAEALAPFLSFDADPYVVVSGGRLLWILDAYTTSADYPYSERIVAGTGRINYLRNSVKVVIDAYDGTTDFYVADAGDPIVRAWARAVPGLFKPIAAMPEELRAHLRYPEGLLITQGTVYAKYHMSDLGVFYNNEDLWQPAREKYYEEEQEMEPYYTLWKASGSEEAEFIQMWPFTPRGRNVMAGWLAGAPDPGGRGRLYAYRLPKDRQVLGPLQFEAKIDQDQQLAQLMTLWGQGGSRVIRGHVLSLPIGDAILHVEPIYLESQSSSFPELQLVAVMQGDQLGYGPSLDAALQMLLGQRAPAPSAADGEGGTPATPATTVGPPATLGRQASDAFEAYLRLQAQGRFEEAGRELARVRELLRELAR